MTILGQGTGKARKSSTNGSQTIRGAFKREKITTLADKAKLSIIIDIS